MLGLLFMFGCLEGVITYLYEKSPTFLQDLASRVTVSLDLFEVCENLICFYNVLRIPI